MVYGCPQKYLFGLLETQYLHLARERVNARTSRIHGTQLIEKSALFARLPKVQPSLTFPDFYFYFSIKQNVFLAQFDKNRKRTLIYLTKFILRKSYQHSLNILF